MNQFVKTTTCFDCKSTVNIDFLLLKSALPSLQHNFPLNFPPCSGEEFRWHNRNVIAQPRHVSEQRQDLVKRDTRSDLLISAQPLTWCLRQTAPLVINRDLTSNIHFQSRLQDAWCEWTGEWLWDFKRFKCSVDFYATPNSQSLAYTCPFDNRDKK